MDKWLVVLVLVFFMSVITPGCVEKPIQEEPTEEGSVKEDKVIEQSPEEDTTEQKEEVSDEE